MSINKQINKQTNKQSNILTNNLANNQTNKQRDPFIRVPNHIIQHSNRINKYILPLYLYSAIHSDIHNSNIVDTNLALVSETFAPSNPSAVSKFESSLQYLLCDLDDITICSGKYNTEETIPGFSCPFIALSPKPTSLISKTTRLQYIFSDREASMDNKWTMLSFSEYYYILNRIDHINQTKLPKSKYNTIELLNLYLYFKQKILQYRNAENSIRKEQNNPFITITMHESIDTICHNTNLSKNTLTKYTNQLIDLGLISIERGQFNNQEAKKNCNKYSLNSYWKTIYSQMESYSEMENN